jgi:hypothetical protein
MRWFVRILIVLAGAVKCWGDNYRGQVGSGVDIQASPFGVPGLS